MCRRDVAIQRKGKAMTTTSERMFRAMTVLLCVLLCGVSVSGEILLEDEFDFFELGETWQEHEDGEPDVFLGVIGDGLLQMQSSGFAEEFRGIETITPISLVGLSSLTVDARLQPINMGESRLSFCGRSGLDWRLGGVHPGICQQQCRPRPENLRTTGLTTMKTAWAASPPVDRGPTAARQPVMRCVILLSRSVLREQPFNPSTTRKNWMTTTIGFPLSK